MITVHCDVAPGVTVTITAATPGATSPVPDAETAVEFLLALLEALDTPSAIQTLSGRVGDLAEAYTKLRRRIPDPEQETIR